MSKYFAGIDYSMSCPSITIGPLSGKYSDCKTFYYTDTKKFDGIFGTNVFGMKHMPYETQMERYDNISEWAMTILRRFNIKQVCLEGYSMGSSAGMVFNIAENTAFLKYKMWKEGIEFHTPAPTQVKKFFTGKGNSNKQGMYDAFFEKTKVDLGTLLNARTNGNPISDIVDSYAMLTYGIANHFQE